MLVRVMLSSLVVMLVLVSGCSGAASEPTVFDGGQFVGGTRPDRRIDWELREAFGLVDGVELVWSSGPAAEGVTSVARKGGESIWLAGATVGVDAPTVIFGGVSAEIDSVVVTVGDSRIDVLLTPVEDGAWKVGVAELPSQWATAAVGDKTVIDVVEIVGLVDGVKTESARLQHIAG